MRLQPKAGVLSAHQQWIVWMTWALVPHSTFLELKLEQTFWKRASCWSQEAACRAVSELGQLPTRLSVSALKRVWDWLALTESNHCSRRPCTRASSACHGLQPPARLRQTAVCPRPRPLLWALANIPRASELSSAAAAQKGMGVSDEWSCFCCQHSGSIWTAAASQMNSGLKKNSLYPFLLSFHAPFILLGTEQEIIYSLHFSVGVWVLELKKQNAFFWLKSCGVWAAPIQSP